LRTVVAIRFEARRDIAGALPELRVEVRDARRLRLQRPRRDLHALLGQLLELCPRQSARGAAAVVLRAEHPGHFDMQPDGGEETAVAAYLVDADRADDLLNPLRQRGDEIVQPVRRGIICDFPEKVRAE